MTIPEHKISQDIIDNVNKALNNKIRKNDIDIVRICTDKNALNGSSLQGYVRTSINQLNSLFNVKKHKPSGDGKVKHEWEIEIIQKNQHSTYITIYDYKDWPIDKDEIFPFHVGAKNEVDANFGTKIMLEILKASSLNK